MLYQYLFILKNFSQARGVQIENINVLEVLHSLAVEISDIALQSIDPLNRNANIRISIDSK